jgi:pilus assembly protein CpaB
VIIRPMFAPKTAASGILPIPAKEIAVSFSIVGQAAVAGFVQPQSEVAVFVSYKLPATTSGTTKNGANNSATKLLFPRVLVLATAAPATSTLTAANGGGGLITLALTQDQAERMILASQSATVYLGLLSDTSVTNADKGVTFNQHFVPIALAQ